MENYKQKYKEALERAKVAHKDEDKHLKATLERIFPELKENEDEKIRKGLINYFNDFTLPTFGGLDPKNILAWLENIPYVIDQEKREGFQLGYKAGLEKQNHDGKKWIYEDSYIKEKEQVYQDGVDDVLENPQKYGLEKQGEPIEVNPTEFDTRLQALIGKFDSLPKEELIGSLSFWMNVVQNDGTYKEAKQSEQKPADKVEPKFKVGDWITDGEHIAQIVSVGTGLYVIDRKDRLGIALSTKYIEKWYHLWTIKDAKDGDVLVTDDMIVLFKKRLENDSILTYAQYDTINDACGSGCHLYYAYVYPATKEQRDTLEKAVADVGYTFDSEKKELKKIEQKPTDLEEFINELSKQFPDVSFAKLSRIAVRVAKWSERQKSTWSEEDERMFDYALDMIEWYSGKNEDKSRLVSNWLKSLKYRVQSKQEWSDEDKTKLADVIDGAEHHCFLSIDDVNWLKSIENRIFPEIKQEWNEKDEKIIEDIIYDLSLLDENEHSEIVNNMYREEIDWLKSLKGKVRPQTNQE